MNVEEVAKELGEKIAFINPKIVKYHRQEIVPFNEGCLSLPGMDAEINRPSKVTVEYLDLDGEKQTLEADKLLARVIQHEYDHLEGILFIDLVPSQEDRDKLIEQMNELEAEVYV